MQVTPSRPTTLSIDQLKTAIVGRVIGPDDPEYDDARKVFIGSIDRRPAVIVRAASTDDVARVIALARETQLPFSVRGGGHSNAGYGVVDDGIVLDMSALKAGTIDHGATRRGLPRHLCRDRLAGRYSHRLQRGDGSRERRGLPFSRAQR